MVFLRVLVGVLSSELWGYDSESEDTGLAVEECWTASSRTSSKDVTSIPPCVRSYPGVSFGGDPAMISCLLSIAF